MIESRRLQTLVTTITVKHFVDGILNPRKPLQLAGRYSDTSAQPHRDQLAQLDQALDGADGNAEPCSRLLQCEQAVIRPVIG